MIIKNTKELVALGSDKASQKRRRDVLACLEAGVAAVDPYNLVKEHVVLKGSRLSIKGAGVFDLEKFKNISVVGGGKAVCAMARAIEDILGNRITKGCINIPELPKKCHSYIQACKATHPIPGAEGMRGSEQIVATLQQAAQQGEETLVIGLISGGGSALMPLPAEGITLEEKMMVTKLLLKTPATIHEINIVRKHLSRLKGGQMACYAYPASFVALHLFDIIDDPFDMNASGPTAADPSTFGESMAILKKYKIWGAVPAAVRTRFEQGVAGKVPETPKPSDKVFCSGKVHNVNIGSFYTAVSAAEKEAKERGYKVLHLSSSIQGEAREVAKVIVAIGKEIQRHGEPIKTPAMVIAGGETTVCVQGTGAGGRNQELVLSGLMQLPSGMTLASFGTDGVDGMTPKPVAGAIVDASDFERALERKLDPCVYLQNNDSYHFFEKVGGLISTGGYTGTNVADIIMIAVL